MTIVEFLTACYDDFERVAKAAMMGTAHADKPDGIADWYVSGLGEDNVHAGGFSLAIGPFGGIGEAAEHMAMHDPTFVLADLAAKRQILAFHKIHHAWIVTAPDHDERPVIECFEDGSDWPCNTVRLLALPFADRPGYDEAWRP